MYLSHCPTSDNLSLLPLITVSPAMHFCSTAHLDLFTLLCKERPITRSEEGLPTIFLVWHFLLIHCWCRFVLHLITLSAIYTLGRTPPGQWIGPSQRPLPDNTQYSQTSMRSGGFEPAIPASEWSQTHALDNAATGIGSRNIIVKYDERKRYVKQNDRQLSFRRLTLIYITCTDSVRTSQRTVRFH